MFATIFPGQGSQQVGMGKFLFDEFAAARTTFEEASDALSINLARLCFESSESDLALTENTQPALLTVSVAAYRVLDSLAPLDPVASAGHSVGEYAALVTSGTLALSDGVKAVRRRGQAMQAAVPVGVGGMAAVIGWEDDKVRQLCAWVQENKQNLVLSPANFNAPGQVVISGHQEAIDWVQANFSPAAFAGAPTRLKLIPLKVSAPFHCALMTPAETEMREVLSHMRFQAARYPVVQNVSAQGNSLAELLRENLVAQISAPVRWVECVLELKKRGARQLIEVGCGRVLAGLTKKIDPEGLSTLNLNSLEELKAVEGQLLKEN